MNRFIGLARVSSREQEREGFSLDVQEDAMHAYAKREKGVVIKIFRIAETATKHQQRRAFQELVKYAKQNADQLDGIIFYKIDRAARNLKDIVLLEELESDYGLPFISITQPVQNTPTGRMIRRTLATMAAFTTEQQSIDIREGIAKRVESGWFSSNPPYGYRNIRRAGRSVVETHPENGIKVKRIFDIRAHLPMTVEAISDQLYQEGLFYSPSRPRFAPSKINAILLDRSYLGFVKFRGQWRPGLHEPLIDQLTWDRVQVTFGKQVYRSHEMVYASELIQCGYCGHPITGEEKQKMTKAGLRTYVYYRCARYQRNGHPKTRLKERDLDLQVVRLLERFCLDDSALQNWAIMVARAKLAGDHASSEVRTQEVRRQLALVRGQKDELLNLRLAKSIDDDGYNRKRADLCERESLLSGQLELADRLSSERESLAQQAPMVFELIRRDWGTMKKPVKHRILRIMFGGFALVGTDLIPDNGTPLELLATG